MTLNIKSKLAILIIITGALVTGASLFVVENIITRHATETMVEKFENIDRYFRNYKKIRHQKLFNTAIALQDDVNLNNIISKKRNNPESGFAQNYLKKLSDIDLMVISDESGKVLSWNSSTGSKLQNISEKPGIAGALAGNMPFKELKEGERSTTWAFNRKIYQTITIPIFKPDNKQQVVASLTIGLLFDQEELEELIVGTDINMTFFLEGEPVLSTADSSEIRMWDKYFSKHEKTMDSLYTHSVEKRGYMAKIGDQQKIVCTCPLGSGGRPTHHILSTSRKAQLAFLSEIRWNILFVWVGIMALLIPLAIYLGGTLSQPVRSLSNAMKNLKNGDFEVSVESTTKDEIGKLTESFNNMVSYMRERYELKRHVCAHTLQMIKNKEGKRNSLSDGMQEMAILISDIRNSTKKLEDSDPSYFIKKLNDTMNYQSHCVFDNNGAVDKFTGDSMIAIFWGNDALRNALNCAVDIQNEFAKHNAEQPFFEGIGIGVNYGKMLRGKIGNSKRIDYTVIGEEVNLCSRLCEEAGNGQILVPGKNVNKEVEFENSNFKFQEVAKEEFKGFSEQFQIMQVDYN